MTTFLMVAHGTDGDVLPVLRIGRELRRRGHDVALLTHARYSRRTREAGIRFVAVDTTAADESSQADDRAGVNELGARTDLDQVRAYYERHGFFAQLRFECRALRRLHRAGDTVLVGLTLSSLSVLTAAELLGAPVACLAASPHHLAVRDRAAAEYAQIFGKGLDAVRHEFGLNGVRDWPAWLSSPRLQVGTWPAWFDAAGAPAPPGTRLAGFVLADEDGDEGGLPPGVLDGETVLIAGSSGRLTGAAFYRAAVSAAVSLGRPAVVVTRTRSLVPGPLPPTVRWFSRLPFKDAIPRAAAVIHHGGIGTAARALAAGTPQLILAAGFDRPDNAARLAAAAKAEWLPESALRPEQVAESLAAVLSRGRAGGPADGVPVDAVASAADALEAAAPR